MKKFFKILATCVMSLCLIVTGGLLVGCKKSTASATLSKVSDMYGFAAMTSGVNLEQNKDSASGAGFLKKATTNMSEEEIVNTVDKYIGIFESIVGGKSPVSTQKETSDRQEYATKLVVKYTNLAGDNSNIEIYFNETDGQAIVEDPDDEEVSTSLVGLMVIGTTEVAITGVKTVEEDEVEISFVATLGTSKVEFSQEVEEGEQEFEYKIYENDQLVEEFSFELEVEDDEIEVEFYYSKDSVVNAYEIEEKYKNNVRYLEIYYQEGNTRNNIEVSISVEAGQTVYVYKLSDNTTIKKYR